MENMIKYTVINGRRWYICRDCGHKESTQYKFCPVCKNTQRQQNAELKALLTMIELNGGI